MKRFVLFFALYLISIVGYSKPIKIAFLTDLHVVPKNASDCTLRAVVKEINDSKFDYVIITGDITNQGSDVELQNVKEILSGLKAPYYMVSGNHETTWSESGCKTYSEIFGNDRFDFTCDSYLFIGVPCGPYMKMGDGFIKYEDILWAKKTISKKLKPGMQLISFAHYPLDEGLSNYKMFLDILKEHNAAADFCGHGHKIRSYSYDGIPGFMGRSLLSADGKTEGYNIIKIDNDSLFVYEKLLNSTETIKFQLPISSNKIINDDNRKDSVSYKHLKSVYQDNASIFNNVGSFDNGIVWANSLGIIKCYDSKQEKIIWTRNLHRPIYAKPTIVDDILAIGTIEGQVLGINVKNGKIKWRIKENGIFVGAPRTENSNLYVAGSKAFFKINAKDGKIIWKNELPKFYSQGLPALNSSSVIFGSWDTNIYSLNKENGKLEWTWNNGRNVDLLSPGNVQIATTDSLTILVAPDRYMTCLSSKSGETLWRSNAFKVRESMGFSSDSTIVYAKTMDGTLIAVEPSSSGLVLKWQVDLGIGYEHNPCPIVESNGLVYLGSRKGEVIAVDTKQQKIRWEEKVGISSVNGFEVDKQGNTWTSLIEGKIYKITKSK